MGNQISNNKIRQIILLGMIFGFLFLIGFNLSDFLPSFLGAITLYVIFRDYYFKLTEVRKWKSWLAIGFLMLLSLLVIIVPIYYIAETLVVKLANSRDYIEVGIEHINKIHEYIKDKTGYDIIQSIDLRKVGEWVTVYTSSLLNKTVDIVTTVVTAYFILYFMLVNSRAMERTLEKAVPLKKSNVNKIGERFRKLIIANVVGIPVVAIGQGLTVFIGYLIFGVSSPFFLFILTAMASLIPIVGGAIVYVPVSLMLLASQNPVGAAGVIFFGFLSAGVDNILRFTFLKRIENIHPLNSVFGIILGLKVFGFIGLIFGPILISITVLLIQVYHDEFSENDKKEENSTDEAEEISENVSSEKP